MANRGSGQLPKHMKPEVKGCKVSTLLPHVLTLHHFIGHVDMVTQFNGVYRKLGPPQPSLPYPDRPLESRSPQTLEVSKLESLM